ncbi:MAG: hypothetical protein ACJ760_04040 [Thermoleophilaceae bacterium]
MSGIAPTTVPLRVRNTRALVAALLLLGAVVAVTLVLVIGGSDNTSHTSFAPTSQVGGPNEAVRGQAAASASGSSISETGGPNESARGQVAASASRP